jgi:prevent-host-death family protein
MREISASEFKAKCLALMDEVASSGEEIVVNKKGKPVVSIVAHRKPGRSLLGLHKGEVRILGDIVSPIDVEWEALR